MRYMLHIAKVADWDKKASGPFNGWQRLAKKTGGVITPGNLASFFGGVAAIYGLWVVMAGEIVNGLIFLSIGRIADVADGVIAEYTKTKSPLGEIIDATIDKIIIAAALIVLGALQLIPWVILIFIALQNMANVISSILAKLRNKLLHPSRLGKVSAAFSWVTLILYPLGDWLQKDLAPSGGSVLVSISIISFVIYIVLGLQASLGYASAVYKVPARKLYGLFK